MVFSDAQNEMKSAYLNGAPGIMASAFFWLIAGIVAYFVSDQASMLVFFLGGTLIHSLAIVISKLLKASGQTSKTNPLNALAIESTFILFTGLFMAYAISLVKAEWFFSIMLMMVGCRYLIFRTLYGEKLYYLLGGAMVLSGMLCIMLNAPLISGVLTGSILEMVFAFVIYRAWSPKS